MAINLGRLKAQLLVSGIQQTNNPLWQVINQLIDSVQVSVNNSAIAGSGSAGIIGKDGLPGPPGASGDDGDEGSIGPIGLQGIDGVAGATGPSGPTTIGPMGLDGEDGNDGLPIPGNQGSTGVQGIPGPDGPITIGPMGIDGEDGEDGMPIPGNQGVSFIAPWSGNIIGCWGDGNPANLLRGILGGAVATPAPSSITISIGRVSYFRLEKAITVANIRWYGTGATTAIYHIAIYRQSDNVRMSADNNPNTTLNAWNAIADVFTLEKDILYYVVVSVDTTGSTTGITSFTDTPALIAGLILVLPTSWPGGLDINRSPVLIEPYAFANVAVTAGVLPNPGLAPTNQTVWVGGMPAIFLDAE